MSEQGRVSRLQVMGTNGQIHPIVSRIITRRTGEAPRDLKLDQERLAGGAEATETILVTAQHRDHLDRRKMQRMVVKRLDGRPAREARVYKDLVSTHAAQVAPELLAVEYPGPNSAFLFLEAVRRISAWPWRDASTTDDLLFRLGRFHTATRDAEAVLPEWDYEGELAAMAASTRDMLDLCRKHPDLGVLARHLPRLNRFIQALPELRRQLQSERPFGRRPIHGDVHSGNALVRRRGGRGQPILLDWGRARLGSPLEDVSSWLQSLRFWDANAQRFHDSFFANYLSAFGMERRLTPDLRAAYWIAGASNVLSGAILHHLCIVTDPQQSKGRRKASFHAATDGLRILRRAHAWTI